MAEHSSISVESAASVFRVDTINQHAARKPKRHINNRSENRKLISDNYFIPQIKRKINMAQIKLLRLYLAVLPRLNEASVAQ
jgi:hypothetical protein